MKKIIAILALLVICLCQLSVSAACGNIEIEVPKDAGKITVCYTKIADWEDVQEEDIDRLLKENVKYENQLEYQESELVRLEDLEEGIYQIHIQGKEEYEFSTAIVSIPMWNETEELMEYSVKMNPKYIINSPEPNHTPETEKDVPIEESPRTGDANRIGMLIIFVMFSLLIVIMTCHKRFKCARMSE